MTLPLHPINVAVLDDYQGVATSIVDWSKVGDRANITVVQDHLARLLLDEAALLDALNNRRIAGAAIDVFDVEPLPEDHPYRRAEHLLATPHVGYVTRGLYERFYRDSVANISAWLDQVSADPYRIGGDLFVCERMASYPFTCAEVVAASSMSLAASFGNDM
jgi:hypothetical protein